jgi:Cu+-exporting ATPase
MSAPPDTPHQFDHAGMTYRFCSARCVGKFRDNPDRVAMESAGVTLVQGDLRGIARARRVSRHTMRNIKQNLFFAFVYNTAGVLIAARILYPAFGLLLSPIIAAAAMSFRSLSVVGNALRLRGANV